MQLLGSIVGWLFGDSVATLVSWSIFSYLLAYVLYFAVVVSQKATLMGWAIGGCGSPPLRTWPRARPRCRLNAHALLSPIQGMPSMR